MTKQKHNIAVDGEEDPEAQVEGEEEEEERACDKDWENMTEEERTAATLLGWESAEVPPAPPSPHARSSLGYSSSRLRGAPSRMRVIWRLDG